MKLVLVNSQPWQPTPDEYREVAVMQDGTLAELRSSSGWDPAKPSGYFSLDGKRLNAYPAVGHQVRPSIHWDIGISLDSECPVHGLAVHAARPEYWYVVLHGRRDGRAYCVGFDVESRRCLGYLGTRGFQPKRPEIEDWFHIDAPQLSTGANYGQQPIFAMNYNPQPIGKDSVPFLLSAQDQIWELDFRNRSVKLVETIANQRFLIVPNSGATAVTSSNNEFPKEPGVFYSLLAQTDRDLVVRTPLEPKQRHFPIPDDFRSQGGFVYLTNKNEMAFVRNELEPGKTKWTVAWANEQGEVRRQNVDLPATAIATPTQSDWHQVAMQELATASFLARSMIVLLQSSETSAPSMLNASFVISLAILAVVSLVLAIATFRRQRRLRLDGAWVWFWFVLVCGPAGWFGYWFHRAWPVIEPCPNCDFPAPRDRSTCCDCRREFPGPRPIGVEVFA